MNAILLTTVLLFTMLFTACGDDVTATESDSSENTSSAQAQSSEVQIPDTFAESASCPDHESGKPFTIYKPTQGDEFTTGDTITISYSIEDVALSTGSLIEISTDGGRTFEPIVTESILPKQNSDTVCISYYWVIPESLVTESNSTAVLKVRDYTDATLKATTDSFTINP
jgi:hypothetical protein